MLKKTLVPFVSKKLPKVIVQQYPQFVSFLKAFYEFLETTGQVTSNVNNFLTYTDIDTTLDQFVSHFQNTFIKNIPQTVLCNKRLLIKHIGDFYRARGTESSFKFLFRILYNDDINITYPKDDLLRASAGNFVQNKVIRTTTVNDTFQFIGNLVTGMVSGAQAAVENVVQININGNLVSEMYLSQIKGNFIFGEAVRVQVSTNSFIEENLYTIVTGIQLTNTGTRYNIGDLIPIIGSNGINATASVDTVSGYITGQIIQVTNTTIVNPNQINQFTVNPSITFDQTASSEDNFYNGMTVLVTSGLAINVEKTIVSYNGASRTANVDSDWNILPNVDDTFMVLLGQVETIVMKDFGIGYSTDDLPTPWFSLSGDGAATGTAILGVIGTYPSAFNSTSGFLSSTNVLQDSYYWQDFSYVIHAQESINTYSDIVKQLVHPAGMIFFGEVDFFLDYIIGPQYLHLERNKFYFPPYEGFTPDTTNNSPYPNTQLFGYDNIVYGDIDTYPNRLFKQIPDAFIQITSTSSGPGSEIIAEYDCLDAITYTGTLGALYGISQYKSNYYAQPSNATITSEIPYNILEDIKTTPGPKYNGTFGGYNGDIPEYVRNIDVKFFDPQQFIDISMVPVNPLEQTILVAFKTSALGTKQSIIGCIDTQFDSVISGYVISILPSGQIEFRAQKASTQTSFNKTLQTPSPILPNTWYIACLRFTDNNLIGNLSLQTAWQTSFDFDINAIGLVNNSSGYFIGNQGKTIPYALSSLYGTSVYGRTPYAQLRPLTQRFISANTLYGQNTFDTVPYLGTMSQQTTEATIITNSFMGEIGYVILWNKYILDTDYLNTYSYVKNKLSVRGIVL